MPTRSGVGLRPTQERERLYLRAQELRKEGLSYNKIIARVEEECGVRLSMSHLSGWLNGKHRPFGSVRQFVPTPSANLAYIIGVKWGDASTSTNRNHMHMIKLRVKDKDFAEEFSRCLSAVLNRSPPSVNWNAKTSSWHTETSSVLLQAFLLSPANEQMKVIEHCDSCEGAFLRGFFDSEGSISRRKLMVYNGDLDKLQYVVRLLKSLGVEATGPHMRSAAGGIVMIKGKEWHVNKNSYSVYVRAISLAKFQELVGFTILRKRDRLSSAVQPRQAGRTS